MAMKDIGPLRNRPLAFGQNSSLPTHFRQLPNYFSISIHETMQCIRYLDILAEFLH
jgi:hypothetical protein